MAQRARLGVFIMAGVVIVIGLFAIPIGLKLGKKQNTFYSYFQGERSLSGLEEGADVKYRGVRIGKITRIGYSNNDITRIKVSFTIKGEFPLKKDMFVETGFLGITGLRYIEVLGGTNDSPLLAPGSEIPSQQSMMSNLTGKVDVIVDKVEMLLNNLNSFTNSDSLKAVKEILENVASITNETDQFIKDVTPDIKAITVSVRSTVKKADLIAGDVKEMTATVNQSIDAETVLRILATVDSTAQSLKNLSENLNLTIRQSKEDFAVSLENLRATLENANELSKILTENPSLILRGENQRERKGLR
jgi:ABC-type transporter Mla subunit MlaD